MGRRGEGEGEGSGPRFEDARIVEEPSRRMTAAAVTLSRGCAERIRDGIGASTSEASASETRRARREFADGGSATGTSSLRDDSGFISLTYTPRKPTATFLRASPLDRARVEFGPSIYSGGSSAPGDDADGSGAARDDAPSRDPTNDASPRPGNPGACGDDGGVVIDATVNRRRSVHQLSFLSNLAERRRWDDASEAGGRRVGPETRPTRDGGGGASYDRDISGPATRRRFPPTRRSTGTLSATRRWRWRSRSRRPRTR